MNHRCGTIAFAGRPNTGKSSLLNRLVGEKLSIVSPRAQTTRHLVTGILTTPDCQYIFVDAPGMQTRHRGKLNRALNLRASEAAGGADVVGWVLEAMRLSEADREAVAGVAANAKVVAIVNQIDQVKPREKLIPFLARVAQEREFAAIVPVSASSGENCESLLAALRDALPDGGAIYPPDQLTDRDERFFAAELLREQLFRTLGEELPYACEVEIASFKEEGRLRRIEATIWVARDSHKPIVLGEKGARLKQMATAARKGMETLFGGKVYLGTWIKVKRGWSEDDRLLRSLGHR
jgi:GTP-binding protein Era